MVYLNIIVILVSDLMKGGQTKSLKGYQAQKG